MHSSEIGLVSVRVELSEAVTQALNFDHSSISSSPNLLEFRRLFPQRHSVRSLSLTGMMGSPSHPLKMIF